MMSRWAITAALTCLIAVVTAINDKEAQENFTNNKERVRRQYPSGRHLSSGNPNHQSAYGKLNDDHVKYDPSGRGFEVKQPQPFFDVIDEQTGEFRSASYSPSFSESGESYHNPYNPESHGSSYYPDVSPRDPRNSYRTPHRQDNYPAALQQNWRPTSKPETYAARPYPNTPYNQEQKYSTCPRMAGSESSCRPAKDCSVWYNLAITIPGTDCKLSDGQPGTCCPDIPFNGRIVGPLRRETKIVKVELQCIDLYSVNAAAHEGKYQLRLMDATEALLGASNVTATAMPSAYSHLTVFESSNLSQKLNRAALAAIETTREIGKRFNLTSEQTAFGLIQFHLKDTILSETCPADPVCDQKTIRSRFRTMDGSCNNIRRPSWGQSRTQYERAVLPSYGDGVWEPRRSVTGGELPSPRLVSISVVFDQNSPSEVDTHWVMSYGQFINHDFILTSIFTRDANAAITCCTGEGQFLNDTELIHPQCLPIEIPIDDPFYSKFNQRCMNFVRSTPAPRSDCRLGPAEQMNGNTHFLDQSNVYGFDATAAAELRTFEKGNLKVTKRTGGQLDLLPADDAAQNNCTLPKSFTGIDPPAEVKCFKAGDARANQNPNLAVAHTVFLREHNRIADVLSSLNPHWDDERLYQEARHILIAEMQHITYNEWLPIVIGRAKMQELGLLPLQRGFSNDYDDNMHPGVINEFAAAVLRFGHSLVQGKHDLVNNQRQKESHIVLRQHLLKMQTLYTPGNLDKFLTGLATQPSQNFDNFFSEDITNHLFEQADKGFGSDLVSINLQRGRDRGIPGYNSFRALCGLPRAKHFSDLLDVISPAIVERFELLYDSVDDIDLFIGGISERKAEDAYVGPTFQCVVADQFLRSKRGDRFFYEFEGQSGSFTEEQLNEIRQMSFARLVCDNSHVESTQPLVFKLESAVNPVVDCDSTSIPRVNLLLWQERSTKPYTRPY